MDYYYGKDAKPKSCENGKETMPDKVTPDIKLKSFFSDQLSGDDVTPLSQAEEYALKRVRRKLKNKISAQESRKRKKQHLENLEKRVRLLDFENESLKKKLEMQDKSLRSLTFQLSKLKSSGNREEKASHYQSRGTQTGVCLKCYLQKQSMEDEPGDFKVQSGKNGRIMIQSDLMEKFQKPYNMHNEYTDFNSILYARSLRDRA